MVVVRRVDAAVWLRMALDAPFWWMALIALAARSLYQPITGWQDAASYGLGHAIFYRTLYWLVACRFSPWKMALLWLGSPLLLFSATWLRPVWAAVFTALWGIALWWSIRQHASSEKNTSEKNTSARLAGYLILLAWVSVCGAGGYGFQSWDYQVHNGRLLDLINYAWPVSYARPDGSYQLLVQYAGYYLWPALAGKLVGISVAMLVQHLWLLVGCWLVLRMTALLIDTKYTGWIAVSLILFGGLNLVGLSSFIVISAPPNLINWSSADVFFSEKLSIPGMPIWLSFWPTTLVSPGVWFGNFISLAESMLWSPNQIVVGWIVVGLLCQAFRQQQVISCLFTCALLVFWSPMIALGLLPMVTVLIAWQLTHNVLRRTDVFLTLSGITVLGVLGVYYASVPVGNQPYGVLSPDRINALVYFLFLLQSWGIYAAFIVIYWCWLEKSMKVFAVAEFFSAAAISVVYYGVNNDLMVRSSAVIYYGLLLILGTVLRALWRAKSYWRAASILLVLLLGIPDGVLNVWQAAAHADVRIAGQSIIDFEEGWQYLGKQDSWFVRYLSADLHPQKNE